MAVILVCLHCADPFRSHGDPPKTCPWREQPTIWLTADDVRWLRISRIRLHIEPLIDG